MRTRCIADVLEDENRRFLIAGCGGGYDIVGGIPLAAMIDIPHRTHFASLSFSNLAELGCRRPDPALKHLFRITDAQATTSAYCPEAWLAHWYQAHPLAERGCDCEAVIWGFDKTGVRPLRAAYQFLVDSLKIDTIIVVDGGVDSLLRGDESVLGTPEEDFATLAAVHGVRGPTKILACIGLGAEVRDGICHEQVFARMHELTTHGGYLGGQPLVAGTYPAWAYVQALDFVATNQTGQRGSHVHRVIRAALTGSHIDTNVWLSPLSSMFWCFDLDRVAETNRILPALEDTETIQEVTTRIEGVRKSLHIRDRTVIPL